MPERMSEYICHTYFQVIRQKLCQNSVSGWRSLEVRHFFRFLMGYLSYLLLLLLLLLLLSLSLLLLLLLLYINIY